MLSRSVTANVNCAAWRYSNPGPGMFYEEKKVCLWRIDVVEEDADCAVRVSFIKRDGKSETLVALMQYQRRARALPGLSDKDPLPRHQFPPTTLLPCLSFSSGALSISSVPLLHRLHHTTPRCCPRYERPALSLPQLCFLAVSCHNSLLVCYCTGVLLLLDQDHQSTLSRQGA